MTNCPECNSGDIEVDSGECRDDGQGYCWVILYGCYCNECGCEFEKIETTEVEYDVTKHGSAY